MSEKTVKDLIKRLQVIKHELKELPVYVEGPDGSLFNVKVKRRTVSGEDGNPIGCDGVVLTWK